MPRLKANLTAAIAVQFALTCGAAVAQNRGNSPASPAGAEAGAPKMTTEQLLKLWERQSQRLKDLKVAIYRIDKTPDWDEELHYEGSAAFKTPQLAYLDFRKVKTKTVSDPKNPKKNKVVDLVDTKKDPPIRISSDYERIVCTGNEVWHYRFDKKQTFIYPLAKDAQHRALDEGPLPFLFNMRADDAQRRYTMSLQGESPTAYFVVIKPNLKEDKESFSTAWVRLDRKFLLPLRITLFSPDNQSIRDFQLSKIEANQGVNNAVFRGEKFPGWAIERNPGPIQEGQADRSPPRRSSAGQAAQRQRAFDRDQPR
jgi:TIGR03009 family protein